MKNSTKTAASSRKLSTAKLDSADLQAIRVRTWFENVASQAIPSKWHWYTDQCDALVMTDDLLLQLRLELGKHMLAWRDSQPTLGNLVALSSLRQRLVGYLDGTVSPTEETLNAFEMLLPGTRVIYDVGLHGLPIWNVLAGNLDECSRLLNRVQASTPGQGEMTFPQRFQCFVDELTSLPHTANINQIPNLDHFSDNAHPIWRTHLDRSMMDTHGYKNVPVMHDYPDVTRAIAGVLALWMLAADGLHGYRLELEWVVMGLCWGVIAYHFGDQIQAFVLSELKKRSQAIDQALKFHDPKALTFDERWTVVIEDERIMRFLGMATR